MISCPLYVVSEMLGAAITQTKYQADNTECDEEYCAWYDEENDCCAITTIAQRMGGRDDGKE